MSKQKSVLMACPTFCLSPDPNQWLSTFLGALNEFSLRGLRVNTYFPYRRNIVDAENEIIQTALINGADYIFRMDDDIWGFQPGFVNKLLDANKEFISGVMFVSGFPYSRCAFKKNNPDHSLIDIYRGKMLELTEADGRGIIPVDLTATPFTLIKTSILEKISAPYFESIAGVAPDSVFCQKLLDAGIQIYAHMDVQLNHRHVTPWNRIYLYNAEARAMLAAKLINPASPVFQMLVDEFGVDGQKDVMQIKGCKMSEAYGTSKQ